VTRKHIPPKIENQVLLGSRRRCAICYGLDFDANIKRGQIAHIDQNNTNADLENLVFLCLVHHDEYDGKTSQSKGLTKDEIRAFKDELYSYIKNTKNIPWPDNPAIDKNNEEIDRSYTSLEIYEKKIRVYRVVRGFLSSIVSEATITPEALFQFAKDTDEALFLFDKELSEYIRELYKKGVRLYSVNKRLDSQKLPIGEERNQLANEDCELVEWFLEQLEVMRVVFYKYIALK
jgi:hypothetical protein